LLQKIAAQTDARMANVQVAKMGDALTIRSTQPGQAFTVSALSSTSQVNAVRNDVLTPNRSVGDAISAIQSLSELANIAVVQGVSVGAQELEAGKFLKIHLGANQGQTMDLELPDYGTPGGRIDALVWDAALPDGPNAQTPGRTVIHIRNAAAAGQAMIEVDTTLAAVLTDRARLGAVMNRLSYAGDNLSQMQTELSKSRSVIEDTNYATSASSLIKNQILNQASMAVLTQANTQPELVMELLRNPG
jgi:flagellin